MTRECCCDGAEAGAGSTLPLRFGGKTSVTSGVPIDAEVEILTVGSTATQPFGGAGVELGDTALIAVPVEGGSVEVLLWTARTQTFHPDAFENVGCQGLMERPVVVVKSTNHFYGGFGPIARSIHCASSSSLQLPASCLSRAD